MSRTPPGAPPAVSLKSTTMIYEERTYAIITPLFGGGVEPGEADPISVVRASEVRGQLRFWWRATRGGQFGVDLNALRDAEEQIWGGPARMHKGNPVGGQSPVQVAVSLQNPGTPIRQFQRNGQSLPIAHPSSLISYGTFPLRSVAGALRIGVRFTLMITFPQAADLEVESTLWAWENFGGLGARTRRGFGAIKLIERLRNGQPAPITGQPADANAIAQWFTQHITKYCSGQQWHEHVPHLSSSAASCKTRYLPKGFLVRNNQPFGDWIERVLQYNGLTSGQAQAHVAALVAWYYPIHKLQQFRQTRHGPFGRSYWPEPDAIRARTTGFQGNHATRLNNADKFPRAIFGLPIIFEFKDKNIDPPTTTLQGQHHDRQSSRLILRPIACANNTYVAAATLLQGPALPPGGLQLVGATGAGPIDASLTQAEASFNPLHGKTDVIQAYLNTL